MPYSAEISRNNPSLLLFLIDQSKSMEDPFGRNGSTQRKADGVADAINRLLHNLILRCTRNEGVRDYYYIGVLGYGETVKSALSGKLAAADTLPISQIAADPLRIDTRTRKESDGAGGVVDLSTTMHIWIDPIAAGGTPMCGALAKAMDIISTWIGAHPTCFPPIVINITDGESTDGDPSQAAQALKSSASNDGHVLLFNLHLSGSKSGGLIEFPSTTDALPDDPYSMTLYNMSSVLPPYMQKMASGEGFYITPGSRGFVFNGDLVSLIRFIDIGSKAANVR